MAGKKTSENIGNLKSSLTKLAKCCPIHSENSLTKFCSQHDTLLCEKCFSKLHKKCNSVLSLENASRGVRSGFALEDLKSRMVGLLQYFERVIEMGEEYKTKLTKQRESITQEIEKTRSLINDYFDSIEKSVFDELDKQYKLCQNSNEYFVSEIISNRKNLQSWVDCFMSVEQELSDCELFTVVKVFDSRTFHLESTIPSQSKFSIIKLHLNENLLYLKEKIGYFGSVYVKESGELTQELSKYQQGIKPIPTIDRKPEFQHSFDTLILKTGIKITTCCFLPNKKLLLASLSEPALFITNLDGSDATTTNLNFNPCDVDLIDDRRAIVTLETFGYQILELDELVLGKCIKPGGNGCYSVSCRSETIIVHSGGNKVLLIDTHGNIKREYTTKHHPYYICQFDNDSFFYDRAGENKIYIVTGDGSENTFYSHPDLLGPRGIDVDDRRNVYVAGHWSDNIHRISPDGQNLDIILNRECGMKYPYDLCVNKDNQQIMIVNNDLKKIEIYTLQ